MKKLFLFILLVSVFTSCEKDALTPDSFSNSNQEQISFRSSEGTESIDPNLINDFYKWYIENRATSPEAQSVVNPFLNDVDWSSGQPFDLYEGNSLVFNVNHRGFTHIPNSANQLVFTKKNNSDIEVKSLIYLPKEDFYTEYSIKPRLFNFTGYVFEYSETEDLSKVLELE